LDDAVTDLDWSPDGSRLFLGTAGGMLYRFDAHGREQQRWRAHDGGVTRLSVQPGDTGKLASAGEDGRVALWVDGDTHAPEVLSKGNDWVEHLAWTPDGRVLAAAARKTISLWRGSESLGMWFDAGRHVLAMAWAPDGRRLATAANKGLYLWRLERNGNDAEPIQLLSFPGAPVAVAWQPNGKALAVGTQDGFLQLWRSADSRARARQLTMRGYAAKVSCLAWHPAGPLIATAGGPDVVLWELPRDGGGARGTPLRHHPVTVTALAWSDDGALLASGDRSGRLCIWNTAGDAVFTCLFEHEISTLQWQPAQGVLAIGDTGGALHLINHSDAGPVRPGPANEEIHSD
jgi:WD40 repeat protein